MRKPKFVPILLSRVRCGRGAHRPSTQSTFAPVHGKDRDSFQTHNMSRRIPGRFPEHLPVRRAFRATHFQVELRLPSVRLCGLKSV